MGRIVFITVLFHWSYTRHSKKVMSESCRPTYSAGKRFCHILLFHTSPVPIHGIAAGSLELGPGGQKDGYFQILAM